MKWLIEKRNDLEYAFNKRGNLTIKDKRGYEIASFIGVDSDRLCIVMNRDVEFVYDDNGEKVSGWLMTENYLGTKFYACESGRLIYRHNPAEEAAIRIMKLDMDDCIVVQEFLPKPESKSIFRRWFSWTH